MRGLRSTIAKSVLSEEKLQGQLSECESRVRQLLSDRANSEDKYRSLSERFQRYGGREREKKQSTLFEIARLSPPALNPTGNLKRSGPSLKSRTLESGWKHGFEWSWKKNKSAFYMSYARADRGHKM